MHLLASKPGGFSDEEGIIDLDQSAGDIVVLSAADSALAALAASVESLPGDYPSVRLANWMQLLKPAAFDLYEDKVLSQAKVLVVSLLGGANYWQYGFERLCAWAAEDSSRQLILVPGDDAVDEQLFAASSVEEPEAVRVWQFLRAGGVANNQQLFYFLASAYLKKNYPWHEPDSLPRCLIYHPESLAFAASDSQANLDYWQQRWTERNVDPAASCCIVIFYRSHLQSANTAMFDELLETLELKGLKPLPIAVASLKDKDSLELVNDMIGQIDARLLINTTAFACNTVSAPDLSSQPTDFVVSFSRRLVVLQLVLSSSTEEDWQSYSQGLRSRDIAMQVVLPEMDGRIVTRAISFKSEAHYSERCQIPVVKYALHRERAEFVADLAHRYCQLTALSNCDKRVALILANYPTKDGRIGNGVGLDTPQSTINILHAMQQSGFPVAEIPSDGTELIKTLLGSVTNNPNTLHQLPCWQSISLEEYQHHFQQMPRSCQKAVLERWGTPEQDPKCRNNRIMLAGIRLGETFVGIQPARGFNLDLQANYHDPDLVPPHSYLAFYVWLRHCYNINAIIHVGKHGNLEWLPGKGSALSEQCWPDIALGPIPHFYPFIVNDPGEGAQAKRRTQAAIIDHLMPPMTRAEVYGDIADLENLVDEYYQALGMDERRELWLRDEIFDKVTSTNVLQELGLSKQDDQDAILEQLDAYLCDIKEAQIRHGLHCLGALPVQEKLTDTLVALLRLPRGKDAPSQGILHNLANDLELKQGSEVFDPLLPSAELWQGVKPELLQSLDEKVWRTDADTRERLELLAQQWVQRYVLEGESLNDNFEQSYPATAQQLQYARAVLLKALEKSVDQELQALITGLQGGFIEPGPSGAPTRGRLDTLPTGRNFFSVDNRSIPSPAAWAIGQRSAQTMLERHLQDHGDYPRQLGLSVWGTATMRTGGDDIAQAFALMGIKPVWVQGSQRVVDFEIVPTMLLGRPRVDVTLRVSGFFRDAFPNVMRLFDAAVQALADYDDPGGMNVVQQNIQTRLAELQNLGMSSEQAQRQASYRVFGSKPGAYGAGLQGLIDERCWEERSDLAEAYVNWGGYAYGNDSCTEDGVEAKSAFENRLSKLEVVVHNQDNREHDLLDSDDYYQFQGGMSNAVNQYSGEEPVIYHNDHSNPAEPKVRTLKEELNRVIRSRVLNPKWIKAMQEHGYKGAFEMAASVDYLFAYDATTNLIDDYQYKSVADALVFDEENQRFMQEHNPSALEETAERLLEAVQRGLWEEPEDYAEKLQDLLLSIDEQLES
ncbi:MAG: cobaltochelatase subunit CobN [Arenicella sp.]